MEKIRLEDLCKRNRFSYWNSCKCLPNFVNVAALILSTESEFQGSHLILGPYCLQIRLPMNISRRN